MQDGVSSRLGQRVVLLFLPLAAAAGVWAHFGIRWESVEAFVVAVWWLSVFVAKGKAVTWLVGHSVAASVMAGIALTTLVFPLVALVVGGFLSAWTYFAISTGLSVLFLLRSGLLRSITGRHRSEPTRLGSSDGVAGVIA